MKRRSEGYSDQRSQNGGKLAPGVQEEKDHDSALNRRVKRMSKPFLSDQSCWATMIPAVVGQLGT